MEPPAGEPERRWDSLEMRFWFPSPHDKCAPSILTPPPPLTITGRRPSDVVKMARAVCVRVCVLCNFACVCACMCVCVACRWYEVWVWEPPHTPPPPPSQHPPALRHLGLPRSCGYLYICIHLWVQLIKVFGRCCQYWAGGIKIWKMSLYIVHSSSTVQDAPA